MLANSYLLVVFLLRLLAGFSDGPVELHTVLESGKQVVFSGQQHGKFQLKIRNSGPVPVLVTERQANGSLRERGLIEPHRGGRLRFAVGSVAMVRSLDARPAEFKVKFFSQEFDGIVIKYESLNR
ncbi:hypothetical protein FNT36_24740 [Hymenobacter setariae]|uniref:Uncharacterized protein n=1 Tax=Hymenobacter setariae TaxID=2594794 RepID=A0A558BKP2_9BACT|nr:hypothetical protein [Hymenobacter setariae]TVT37072.1 hypothetical protein FNT36_24740 [Hymenobacter setariae]